MTKAHDDEAEAVKAFSDRVNEVIGGRWLGVIVNIDDDGNVHVFRTTWQFPREKYIDVVGLLATDLSKDAPSSQVAPAMALGDFLSLQKKLQENKVSTKAVGALDSLSNRVSEAMDEIEFPLRDDDPVHDSMDDAVTERIRSGLLLSEEVIEAADGEDIA